MKKLLYAAALLLGLSTITSCNKTANGPVKNENSLIGAWKVESMKFYSGTKEITVDNTIFAAAESEGAMSEIEFKEGGKGATTYTADGKNVTDEFTYTVSSGKITITESKEVLGVSVKNSTTYTAEFSDNKLLLSQGSDAPAVQIINRVLDTKIDKYVVTLVKK